MGFVTSKTHRFIAVRQFPSDYVLNKFHQHESKYIEAVTEYSKRYHNFYKEVVEKVTGKSYTFFQREYMIDPKMCSKEEIREVSGIKICESGNKLDYCIPIENSDEIFNWILEAANKYGLKTKVLKRTRGSYYDHGATDFFRKSCKTPEKHMEHMKDMFPM